MEDMRRCFPVVGPMIHESGTSPRHRPIDDYDAIVSRLSSICWDHYNDDEGYDRTSRRRRRSSSSSGGHHRHSLYVGSLGPCAYVRYRLGGSLLRRTHRACGGGGGRRWTCSTMTTTTTTTTTTDYDTERRRGLSMLRDAARIADLVLESSDDLRITLLEGERVGALALSAVVRHALGDRASANRAKDDLLDIGASSRRRIVLYGRCGYLHAIAFVRSGTNDDEYGQGAAARIVRAVLLEGERTSIETRSTTSGDMPLLWTWHGKAYLGAIHGVVGILFTLLCFRREVSSMGGAMDRIRTTITNLDRHCYASGNLMPSLGNESGDDRLVHLCHGAPGHVLLLVKAYEVFDVVSFLERAEEIARGVICRRGLLRKGLGLCHGISGNAYCFLSLYRGRRLWEQRTRESSTSGETISDKGDEWIRWAHTFARFGLENVNELFHVPDHPYSLYEGISGFVMLLHDLGDPDNSRFPCFEP
ncbi:hypothetical protein ACHAXA_001258 [Cyclostephanos tholiformis]|uniref:LanC-like protein 2 n=1 Tax=Cyclostephanos tholiformis TaxID=382380 RepID=A0ABD3RAW5_9STRA